MKRHGSRPLPVVLAVLASLLALLDVGLAWPGANAYAKMYADFGSVLPAGTELALSWGRVALTGLALAGCGVSVGAAVRGREAWPGAVAFAAQLAASAVFLSLLYLPIFSIAHAVE